MRTSCKCRRNYWARWERANEVERKRQWRDNIYILVKRVYEDEVTESKQGKLWWGMKTCDQYWWLKICEVVHFHMLYWASTAVLNCHCAGRPSSKGGVFVMVCYIPPAVSSRDVDAVKRFLMLSKQIQSFELEGKVVVCRDFMQDVTVWRISVRRWCFWGVRGGVWI